MERAVYGGRMRGLQRGDKDKEEMILEGWAKQYEQEFIQLMRQAKKE